MNSTSRPFRALVVACALGLTLSACSSPEPPPAAIAPTSEADFYARHDACMIDRGWTPRVDADGSSSFNVTNEQKDAFQSDNAECVELIGGNLEPVKSEEEWLEFYDRLVQTNRCLIEYGLDLPAPPTFQSWQDSGRNWGPYGDVPLEIIQEELPALEQACPQPSGF